MSYPPTISQGFHISEPITSPTLTPGGTLGALTAGVYKYAISYVTSIGETHIGPSDSVTLTTQKSVLLTNIPENGNIQVVSCNIYRTVVGGSVFKYVTTISNSTTSYLDTMADVSLGVNAVTLSTADQTLVNLGTSYFDGLIKAVSVSGSPTLDGFTDLTANGNFLKITYINVSTAGAGVEISTISNNKVSSNSLIHANIISYSGTIPTDGVPLLSINNIIDGSFDLILINASVTALTGNLIVYCSIIN